MGGLMNDNIPNLNQKKDEKNEEENNGERDSERFKLILRKIEFFKEKDVDVHIDLHNVFDQTTDDIIRRFYNGKIKDIGSDFILFVDRKAGEVFIFINEIRTIEQFIVNNGGGR